MNLLRLISEKVLDLAEGLFTMTSRETVQARPTAVNSKQSKKRRLQRAKPGVVPGYRPKKHKPERPMEPFTKQDIIDAVESGDPAWSRIIRTAKRRFSLRKLSDWNKVCEKAPTSTTVEDDAEIRQEHSLRQNTASTTPAAATVDRKDVPKNRNQRRQAQREATKLQKAISKLRGKRASPAGSTFFYTFTIFWLGLVGLLTIAAIGGFTKNHFSTGISVPVVNIPSLFYSTPSLAIFVAVSGSLICKIYSVAAPVISTTYKSLKESLTSGFSYLEAETLVTFRNLKESLLFGLTALTTGTTAAYGSVKESLSSSLSILNDGTLALVILLWSIFSDTYSTVKERASSSCRAAKDLFSSTAYSLNHGLTSFWKSTFTSISSLPLLFQIRAVSMWESFHLLEASESQPSFEEYFHEREISEPHPPADVKLINTILILAEVIHRSNTQIPRQTVIKQTAGSFTQMEAPKANVETQAGPSVVDTSVGTDSQPLRSCRLASPVNAASVDQILGICSKNANSQTMSTTSGRSDKGSSQLSSESSSTSHSDTTVNSPTSSKSSQSSNSQPTSDDETAVSSPPSPASEKTSVSQISTASLKSVEPMVTTFMAKPKLASTSLRKLDRLHFEGEIFNVNSVIVTAWTCKVTGKSLILKEQFNRDVIHRPDKEVKVMHALKGSLWVPEVIDAFSQPSSDGSASTSEMILMERCSMDLFDFRSRVTPTAREVKDVKPENTLVNTNKDGSLISVKISDFGTSVKAACEISRSGTSGFISLEVLNDKLRTPMMDWYAMGVLLFNLTSNDKLPFEGDLSEQLKRMRAQKKHGGRMEKWELADEMETLPRAFFDLMYGLLEVDMDRRLGSNEDISDHSYFYDISPSWLQNIFDITEDSNPRFRTLTNNKKYASKVVSLAPLVSEAGLFSSQMSLSTPERRRLDQYKCDGIAVNTRCAVVSGWTCGSSGQKVVVKEVFNFSNTGSPEDEVEVLKALKGSSWIPEIYDSFFLNPVSEKKAPGLVIIQERCSMDLYEFRHCHQLSGMDVKFIAYQMSLALSYIHSKDFLHRDIKLDNILLNVTPDMKLMSVKVVDFGTSIQCDENGEAEGSCGTHGFIPPEVLAAGMSNKASDWFSLGAVLFHITTDFKFPYGKGDESAQLERMENEEIEEWIPVIDVDQHFKSLMDGLLELDLSNRLGYESPAIEHKFFDGVPSCWSRNVFDESNPSQPLFKPLNKALKYSKWLAAYSPVIEESSADDVPSAAEAFV
ncbi:hypothetical protein HDU97_007121 [Phlyctochytrium planicorne]|nr:hypothetical protein HDU97_007121 [Phlyctochytrium planicorne]